MVKIKQKFNYGVAALGLVLFAVGVLFVVFTNAVTLLTVTLSIITLVLGIGFGSFQLARIEKTLGFAVKISAAIAAIVCGTVTLILHESAAGVVADVFCLLLIIDGSFKLHSSINAIKYKVFGWWFLTVLSLFVIIVAYVMAKQSFDFSDSETSKLPVLLGITICVDGVANVFAPIYELVCRKKQTKIIIDAVSESEANKTAPKQIVAEVSEQTPKEHSQAEDTTPEQTDEAGEEQSESAENAEQTSEGESTPAEQATEGQAEQATEEHSEAEDTNTEQTDEAGEERSESTEQASESEQTTAEQAEKPAEA